MNVSSFDLNLLVAFDALLTERSVTRAAKRLGLSQPAMSHALARLRDGVGDELFERARHGIVPTRRALAMAQPVRAAMASVQQALTPDHRQIPAREVLKVSATAYTRQALLPQVIARLSSAPRPVSIAIEPLGSSDTALAIDWTDGTRIGAPGSMLLLRSPFCVAVRRGHPVVGRTLGPNEFMALSHVAVQAADGRIGDGVDSALLKLGQHRDVVARTDDFETAAALAAGTDLVAVVPIVVARMHQEDLRVLASPLRTVDAVLRLVSGRADVRNSAAAWLRQQIVAAGRQLSRGRREH